MPRVRESSAVAATPRKTSIKIPLNDDRQEKANRLQQRKAQQGAQMDAIRASATPNRRRPLANNSPRTPAHDQDSMLDVTGTAVTPMKRMPLLANFEEWMKLATDNKINATNSWNFALIDYFHDMSLLKEGDGVNFQKASCTLDGCVKIYTSRVDSVATDTGKLLSGLAESGNKKRRGDTDEDADGDEEEEEGEDGQKKRKKRAQRSAEATLAPSFAQLQNKKMELELSVDPLFKKASADFDEGGAKGLLLNHLAIDADGRIVFDSSDDAKDATANNRGLTPAPDQLETIQEVPEEDDEVNGNDIQIDISGLAARFFPDLSRLDEQDICPSLKTFDLGDSNGTLDLPFLKAPDDWRQDESSKDHGDDEDGNRSGVFLDEDNAPGFDDDDDGGMAGFDLPPETGFGEGGEVWAREAAHLPQARVHNIGMGEGDDVLEGVEDGALGSNDPEYGLSVTNNRGDEQENILSYFDQALKKNWAGPEHWRIRRIKEIGKAPPPTKRKEKEPFEINFSAPMPQAMADVLYTPASSNSTITLPKAQWKSKSRNLLPDDKHFNSRQLLRLFLKPNARMGARRTVGNRQKDRKLDANAGTEVDEAYWAQRERDENELAAEEAEAKGDYDADFFQDDGLGLPGDPFDDDNDDQFADARDHFSPPAEDGPGQTQSLDATVAGNQEGAFGTQLVTQSRRIRPEYVQYARVAKKVDIRRLKDNLWKGIGFEESNPTEASETLEKASFTPANSTLKFTEVMNDLQTVYPSKAMADISTSYCFICLLHLANEKGLVINNEPNFEELSIRRDFSADLSVGGE
ncbi:barren [Aaosphaeria arxii CBS 175.79]|uniref:Condensin complex subunit 2 n=1 Tax=Aaosphaeria arxii CBS 175.79 TaxID=1450172 RepID=A0A6A5XPP8_9PLEO|nr:barren [Aaosphaeria arxii CBS 175.79]KAF2014700.1 barren [Aaosphaeria arxii CBS 175.79]